MGGDPKERGGVPIAGISPWKLGTPPQKAELGTPPHDWGLLPKLGTPFQNLGWGGGVLKTGDPPPNPPQKKGGTLRTWDPPLKIWDPPQNVGPPPKYLEGVPKSGNLPGKMGGDPGSFLGWWGGVPKSCANAPRCNKGWIWEE